VVYALCTLDKINIVLSHIPSFSGVFDRLLEHDDSPHQGENGAISLDLQGCQAAGKTLSEGPIQTNWKSDCHDSSHLPGPTMVLELAECEESSPMHVKILRSSSSLETGDPGEAGLVD